VNKNRLEAFSDGVLAIIITIMVLELHTPAEPTWHGLAAVLPTFLIPFSTRWMDESAFVQVPVLVYGLNLFCASIAYFILQQALIRQQGRAGALAQAVGPDWKGKSSPLIYLAAIAAGTVQPLLGIAVYTVVAPIWLVPDRRVEHFVTRAHQGDGVGDQAGDHRAEG
jgi:uncharacterized membrane protein